MSTVTAYTELSLGKVVITIVITFLVCQIPRIFLAFYRVGFREGSKNTFGSVSKDKMTKFCV